MEKKGFLERLGLIERVPVENEQDKEDLDKLVKAVLSEEDPEKITETPPPPKATIIAVPEPPSPLPIRDPGYGSKFSLLENPPITLSESDTLIQIDNNKPLPVADIYKLFKMDPNLNPSVFVIENFLKALPPLLSEEIKRDTVLKIISSAGMDMNHILNDGKTRLKNLNDYSKNFETSVIQNIAAYEKEIQRLNTLIDEYLKQVKTIREENEKQSSIISSEIEKIHNILDFISIKY